MSDNKYYLTYTDELYHYGVKGMKWGHRKKYEAERAAYKQAKKDYREARRNTYLKSYTAIGRTGLKAYKNAENKQNKAELKMIDAKAKYKAAKAKTAEKAEKAEFNVYRREMQKSGLAGSAMDKSMNNRSTRIYDHVKVAKGKKYAEAVEKRVQNQVIGQLAASAAVTVGSMVVVSMLENRS